MRVFDLLTQSFKRIDTESSRSAKMKLNVIYMIFIKGGNILVSFLLVPLTLSYVSKETYGIWITLSSMVTWLSFFNVGLNNGLRNKLTEAFALGDTSLGKRYVSTTYALLCLIFIPLLIILFFILPLFDWCSILNISSVAQQELITVLRIIVVYFCINSILTTINVILTADQRPADSELRLFFQQVLVLLITYIMTRVSNGSLFNLCVVLCVTPIIVSFIFNVTLFSSRYRLIKPSVESIDLSLSSDLFKLGIQFFIIQIAVIIEYQLSSFLILRYYGAEDVTSFNIAQKYFNILYMGWNILITPLWAATTDALAKNDKAWVRSILIRYNKILTLFVVAMVLQLVFCNSIYKIWVGNDIVIPFALSIWVMLYNLTLMFSSTFVNVLNGAGILKVQTITCFVSPLVFLGCFFMLYHLGVGVYSVLVASVVANFNGIIIAPIQCIYNFFIKNSILQ